jgi:hypothetical protein
LHWKPFAFPVALNSNDALCLLDLTRLPFSLVPGRPGRLNVAETDLLALMVSPHDPVPEQAPPHPPNLDPGAGAAWSVIVIPSG